MNKGYKLIGMVAAMVLAGQVCMVQAAPRYNQDTMQQKVLESLQTKKDGVEQSSLDFQVHWNTKEGIPEFIKGVESEETIDNEREAVSFVSENEALFKIDGGDFKIRSSFTDDYDMTHYRVYQEIDGIEVYGKELIVHTDKDGRVYAINGQLQPGIETVKWSKFVEVTPEESVGIAKEFLDIDELDDKLIADPESKTYVYNYNEDWYLVNLVTLQFNEPYPANYKIFVDAMNGNIVDSFNAVADGAEISTGINSNGETVRLNTYLQNGLYYLYDVTHPAIIETFNLYNKLNAQQPGTRITSSTGIFNNPSDSKAVDVHTNLAKTYEYFYQKFGRKSFDNNNATITASVSYYDQESGPNNAFWNGRQMLFGDGDGKLFAPFGAALDVVAHEFTHAVTQYTANLEYKDQSGAINESMSDVFGILCEGKESNWWLVGEDCYTPGKPGDALRDVRSPGSVDQPQPAHMSEYKNVSYDNGGVHINSGIPNKAFYNIVKKLDFDNTGKIYYRALTAYLTPKSDFMDLRNAVLQSATDIYGVGSKEYNAVESGFADVGLGSVGAKDTYEPNNSAREAYNIESGAAYKSYISSESDVDIYRFDTRRSGDINVSLKGIDGDFDIYLFNGQGQLVAKSENSEYMNENLSYTGQSSDRYYIKIIGYNGSYSQAKPYTLVANY